jgi:(E)-4-hydroxy-3-methylbut-2-enyl-diphosphate synthase
MTNTKTDDVQATLSQIRALATAGAVVVRVAVPDEAAVKALPALAAEAPVPLVADIHFEHEFAIAAVNAGMAGIRINPGNIGGKDAVRRVVEAAQEYGTVIRVGVNSGSLQRDLREMARTDPAGALVESAVRSCGLLEEFGFDRIKVSAKSSSPLETIAAYRALARRVPYPLHLGLTEAGTRWSGSIRSSVAIGILLAEGVGDTIRVSLTGDPVEEVRVGLEILRTLELAPRGAHVISCPTCGRTEVDIEALALEVERRLLDFGREIEVAVMGCIVNGPGESRHANLGISLPGSGESPAAPVFVDGQKTVTLRGEHIVEAFQAIVLEYVESHYGKPRSGVRAS